MIFLRLHVYWFCWISKLSKCMQINRNRIIWFEFFAFSIIDCLTDFYIFYLQEKDPVARDNPDLHFNRAVVCSLDICTTNWYLFKHKFYRYIS